jgi:hypothetical protein
LLSSKKKNKDEELSMKTVVQRVMARICMFTRISAKDDPNQQQQQQQQKETGTAINSQHR